MSAAAPGARLLRPDRTDDDLTLETEVVPVESLDPGAVILLGESRERWRLDRNDEVYDGDGADIRLVNVSGDSVIERTLARETRLEVVCGRL